MLKAMYKNATTWVMNNQSRRLFSFPVILSMCQLLVVATGLTIKFWAWDFDDGFIVYRYVENILAGHGWVYNLDQNYNASTSVLNTVLIVLGSLFTPSTQIAAHLLGGGSLFLIGIGSFFVFRREAPVWFSCFVASVIVFLMGNNFTWGLESNLFYGMLLCFTALDLYGITSWFLLSLLVLVRPDAVILVGLCLLRGIWRGDRWPRGMVTVALVLLPWVVFSLSKFGQVFPATLSQKVWQGSSGFWGEGAIFLKGLFNYIRGDAFAHITGVYWAPVILVAPLVLVPQGLLYLCKNSAHSLLLMVFFIFSVLGAYSILNVPNYHWYYTGFLLIAYVLAFFGVMEAHGGWLRELSRLDIPCLVLTLTLSCWIVSKTKVDFFDVRTDVYKQLSTKINAAVGPEATIAAVEVGVFGYQTKKPIIDIVGLTTPYGEFITGRNNKKLFDELKPDGIVLHNPLMPHEQAVFADPRFALNYQQHDLVAFPGYSQLIFFTRVPERSVAEGWPLTKSNSDGIVEDANGEKSFLGGDPWIELTLATSQQIVSPVFVLDYDLELNNSVSDGPVFGRVYYAGSGQAFTEDRAVPALLTLGAAQRTLVNLALPGTALSDSRQIERIRFDPIQDMKKVSAAKFRIHGVRISTIFDKKPKQD